MKFGRFGVGLACVWAVFAMSGTGSLRGQALRLRPDFQQFGTGACDGDKGWVYTVTTWERGGLFVSIFRVGRRDAKKNTAPKHTDAVLIVVSRQTHTSGLLSGGGRVNEDVKVDIPIGNFANAYLRFKEGEHQFRPKLLDKVYNLDKGALFVIDHGAKPVKVEQLRVDLNKLILPEKVKLTEKEVGAALQQLRKDKTAVNDLLKKTEGR